MKHQNITTVSISDPTGTQAPSAGANGHLGRLALKNDIISGSGIQVTHQDNGKIEISLYQGIDVSAFSNTTGTLERGQSVTSTTLNWTINKTETSQSINQGIGAVTNGIRTYNDSFAAITTDKTYTITASDGTTSDNASTSILFRQRRWWGINASSTATTGLILSLGSSEFSTSRSKSFTINGGGQYLYYAYPSSFGAATFTVNGLLNTAWTLTVVSHTNASGYTENYNVYRSNTIQNGTGISIVVS